MHLCASLQAGNAKDAAMPFCRRAIPEPGDCDDAHPSADIDEKLWIQITRSKRPRNSALRASGVRWFARRETEIMVYNTMLAILSMTLAIRFLRTSQRARW